VRTPAKKAPVFKSSLHKSETHEKKQTNKQKQLNHSSLLVDILISVFREAPPLSQPNLIPEFLRYQLCAMPAVNGRVYVVFPNGTSEEVISSYCTSL